MIVSIPDHYAPAIGGALVSRAVEVCLSTGIVPAYLHQFADVWDNHGLHFGGSDVPFWEAVIGHDKRNPRLHQILDRAGVL